MRHGRFRRGPTPTQMFDVVEDVRCEKNLLVETADAAHKATSNRLLEAARRMETKLGTTDQPGTEQRERGVVETPSARVR